MKPYSRKLLSLLRRVHDGTNKVNFDSASVIEEERRRSAKRVREIREERMKLLAVDRGINIINMTCKCKEAAEGEHECPQFDLLEELRQFRSVKSIAT